MQQPKIAILSHFGTFQAGYALHVGWLERARLLERMGQDFDFLVSENMTPGLYPHQKSVLVGLDKNKSFGSRVEKQLDNYRDVLKPYDVILTADLLYQSKGHFLVWNEALRQADSWFAEGGNHKRWLHWIHSAWVEPNRSAPYPECLRFKEMPRSTMVYMNESELNGVRWMYGTDKVACVYNPKDFRSFHNFTPLAWDITEQLDLPSKDVVQVFPHCATRQKAKGADAVLQAHAALKKAGAKVGLVMAVSNAKQVDFEVARLEEYAKRLGLVPGEDVLWTHRLTDWRPVDRQTVANLFLASNLFVFGSWREVCPNVLLEAKVSGNLLVVSSNLPCAYEFAGDDALYFDGSHKSPGVPDAKDGPDEYVAKQTQWDALAQRILKRLPPQDHKWQYSYERIWHDQLKPLIYKENTT
jgi:hypothetical protein